MSFEKTMFFKFLTPVVLNYRFDAFEIYSAELKVISIKP